jgi:hypothetical protein
MLQLHLSEIQQIQSSEFCDVRDNSILKCKSALDAQLSTELQAVSCQG